MFKRISLWILMLTTSFIEHINSQSEVFIDVAQEKGIVTGFNSSPIINGYTYGSGVSFYDFNNDGWDDLSFTLENDSLKFYMNNEGNFELVSSFVYGYGIIKEAIWVDYDNDGHLDLFLTAYSGVYKLFRNDGNFNFSDVSMQAGLNQLNSAVYGASFGDYNKDGFLDLYVCIYYDILSLTPINLMSENRLYKNNGDGTFTNVTQIAGVGDGIKASFQSVWFDYDQDSWLDLYVINDFDHKNSLYKNNGDGTFTNVTDASGVGMTDQHPMTASVADFNNDGHLDIFMTNTGDFFNRKGMLLVNNGNGTFTESATEFGLDNRAWSWGATWFDYDNDTFQDLYVTTGVISDSSIYQQVDVKNFFYKNHNATHFTDATNIFTNHNTIKSYAVARGDFNNNGFYDIVVHNNAPANAYLWQNPTNNNNYIKITLEGTASNKYAISSWIKVYAGGNQYTQYTLCGENYLSQNSQHHILGLAQYDIVDSVIVEYSRGHIDKYYNLNVNQRYYFKEGETWNPEIEVTGDINFCKSDSVMLSAQYNENYQFLWSNGEQQSNITVKESGAYWYSVENQFGVKRYSDTIIINVIELPEITQHLIHPNCNDSNDGEINLEINTLATSYEVLWASGDTGTSLLNIFGGTYHYSYYDVVGCHFSDSVFLYSPPEMNVQVQKTNDNGSGNGTINLFVFGGIAPFSTYLNNELVDFPVSDLPGGNYQISVIDANDCEIMKEVEIFTITGLVNLKNNELNIYPNPLIEGRFSMKTNFPIDHANLFIRDAVGNVVYKETISCLENDEYEINYIPKSSGVYLFTLESSLYVLNRKLLVY